MALGMGKRHNRGDCTSDCLASTDWRRAGKEGDRRQWGLPDAMRLKMTADASQSAAHGGEKVNYDGIEEKERKENRKMEKGKRQKEEKE